MKNVFHRGRRKPDLSYHNADRRRTAANLRAALPDMDKEMAALACQTADKLDAMSDADFAAQRFHFTDE